MQPLNWEKTLTMPTNRKTNTSSEGQVRNVQDEAAKKERSRRGSPATGGQPPQGDVPQNRASKTKGDAPDSERGQPANAAGATPHMRAEEPGSPNPTGGGASAAGTRSRGVTGSPVEGG